MINKAAVVHKPWHSGFSFPHFYLFESKGGKHCQSFDLCLFETYSFEWRFSILICSHCTFAPSFY